MCLQVLRGEAFIILGPSGQGKTTLLKTMAGLIEPQQGEVFVDSMNLFATNDTTRHSPVGKMGMLFQRNALFDSMTCLENIEFSLREAGARSHEDIRTTATFFLEAVGLSHAANLFPDEISGGMQKRLGIARALALRPQIVFYDDPTAGLDPITARKIVDLILDMQKSHGSTVVAVTNDMARAYQLGTRFGFLFNGELLITGDKEQTLQSADPRVQQFIHGLVEGPLDTVE
ncbi:MAG: ATP-binding cassette domain-containing protein [Bdellovibrionaceae bacterium]|nr:ATP-binding cassette domain-containing protein [Pseudobdellovibrionaceae bacterium]